MNQFFAFNIWSIESAMAVIDAHAKYGRNCILQTSSKAYSICDKEMLREFTTRYSESKGIKTYLHLDHCKNLNTIREAIDYGWDSVMIDASDKDIDENIDLTNKTIEIAKPKNVLVEAEIGQITGTSGLADIKDVEKFVKKASPDLLAVAIGTAHGLYKGIPVLDYDLLKRASDITNIPLVIHGGTGLSDQQFLNLLSNKSVKKINVSTDVKQSYRKAISDKYENKKFKAQGFDPIEIVLKINEEIQSMVSHKLDLLEEL